MFASKNKIDAFGKTTTDKDYRRVFPKLFPLVQEMYQSLSEQSSILVRCMSQITACFFSTVCFFRL